MIVAWETMGFSRKEAIALAADEKRRMIMRVREAGVSQASIGRFMGSSKTVVYQIINAHNREKQRKSWTGISQGANAILRVECADLAADIKRAERRLVVK